MRNSKVKDRVRGRVAPNAERAGETGRDLRRVRDSAPEELQIPKRRLEERGRREPGLSSRDPGRAAQLLHPGALREVRVNLPDVGKENEPLENSNVLSPFFEGFFRWVIFDEGSIMSEAGATLKKHHFGLRSDQTMQSLLNF